MNKHSTIATWNIEGYTLAKQTALQQVMLTQNIDILSIQETHRPNSDYFVTDEG